MSDLKDIITGGLRLIGAGLALLGRPLRVVLPKPLRGPFHVYPLPGTIAYEYSPHTCLRCTRYDQDETPYTDPPCPETKL